MAKKIICKFDLFLVHRKLHLSCLSQSATFQTHLFCGAVLQGKAGTSHRAGLASPQRSGSSSDPYWSGPDQVPATQIQPWVKVLAPFPLPGAKGNASPAGCREQEDAPLPAIAPRP